LEDLGDEDLDYLEGLSGDDGEGEGEGEGERVGGKGKEIVGKLVVGRNRGREDEELKIREEKELMERKIREERELMERKIRKEKEERELKMRSNMEKSKRIGDRVKRDMNNEEVMVEKFRVWMDDKRMKCLWCLRSEEDEVWREGEKHKLENCKEDRIEGLKKGVGVRDREGEVVKLMDKIIGKRKLGSYGGCFVCGLSYEWCGMWEKKERLDGKLRNWGDWKKKKEGKCGIERKWIWTLMYCVWGEEEGEIGEEIGIRK
jgi:hypothetical protein